MFCVPDYFTDDNGGIIVPTDAPIGSGGKFIALSQLLVRVTSHFPSSKFQSKHAEYVLCLCASVFIMEKYDLLGNKT